MGKVFDKDSAASRREIPPIVMRADVDRKYNPNGSLDLSNQPQVLTEEERRNEAYRALSAVFPNLMVCQCGSSDCHSIRVKRAALAILAVFVLVMVHDYFFVWLICKKQCPGKQS